VTTELRDNKFRKLEQQEHAFDKQRYSEQVQPPVAAAREYCHKSRQLCIPISSLTDLQTVLMSVYSEASVKTHGHQGSLYLLQ